MQDTKIMIADDHKIVIDGIKKMLSEIKGVSVVGEARNGKEAIQVLVRKNIDLAILDIGMEPMNGLEVAEYIQDKRLPTKVVMLTMHDRKEYIYRLMDANVDGYILKGKGINELVDAINAVSKGKKFYSRELVDVVLQKSISKTISFKDRSDSLSKREKEVIRLIAKGLTTKKIADELFISKYTVETHRKNIMAKLELSNIAELVRYALDNGLG